MAIRINEMFYSIQGEGILTGAPTIFIRTTGCNLRCAWCDTEYAFYEGKDRDVRDIVEEIQILKEQTGCMRVCLTGGEPLIQEEVPELIFQLLFNGFHLTLETNGSISLFPLLNGLRDHPKMRD
ncbi:MAG: 7-carboxy-7-deazaguanine synthase QueE, partial [Thermoplasmata archaeon]|nr:7-carboxy-7-deazaguanine synthase QueE [Thermoplasmata archaeon]